MYQKNSRRQVRAVCNIAFMVYTVAIKLLQRKLLFPLNLKSYVLIIKIKASRSLTRGRNQFTMF